MTRSDPYRARRDFSATPEPSPDEPAKKRPGSELQFVMHKHDARRLHYDLRLEIGDALASWAIPRGPSYDPSDKRLAVETEDHPLAYAEFEGRIPHGEYGAGDSLVWDRGTWQSEPPGEERAQREKGHLTVRLRGEKLKGLWHLVRTRRVSSKQQWLFFKGKDALAGSIKDIVAERPESVVSGRRLTRGPVRTGASQARHPTPIELLLRVWPTLNGTPARGGSPQRSKPATRGKRGGTGALAAVSGRRIAVQSRDGFDLARRFPSIVAALSSLDVAEVVFQGEIVGREKVSRREPHQPEAGDARLIVSELLWLDGEDQRQKPLGERRELLESLLADATTSALLAAQARG